MILRDYQEKQIQSIRNEFTKGSKRILMQLATGGGKTVMFSYIVKSASVRGKKCLILTDRMELLEQAGGTFEKVGISYDNITAQTKQIPNSNVMVAMVETIKRRVKSRLDFTILLKSIDLLVIDECHKHTFDKIFDYLNTDCYVIGATATPVRKSREKPLSKYFDQIVTGASIGGLINDRYLAKPNYFGVSVDLSKVKMKRGEFDEHDLEKVYSDVKVFEGLKHNLNLHAKGLKTMIFCPSVQSSLNVAKELSCLHVDGTMNKTDRKAILNEFESTPGSIITNVGIATTGYDCPTIECIVLYRATTSLPLYLQMIGRGSRTTESKSVFKILDFGMNVQRFGYWHSDRNWSLDSDVKKRGKKKDVFPVKFCPECGAIVSAQARSCEHCGYVWPVTEKERIFAELEQLTYADIQRKMNEAETVEEMEQIREAKGYKIGYLLHKFDKIDQFKDYALLKGYKKNWAYIQAKRYNVI